MQKKVKQIIIKSGLMILSLQCGHSVRKPRERFWTQGIKDRVVHCPQCGGYKK